MDEKVPNQLRSKLLVIAGVTGAVGVALYFGLGMPGMDHGDAIASMDHVPSTTARGQVTADRTEVALLDPTSFAARIGPKAILVNVHVPFEGDIDGTILSIPFDSIAERAALLPSDLNTPLLVYCRSGRMSAIATAELVRLGYRDVSELDGGMLAWEASGRTLVRVSRNQVAT